MFHSVDTSRIFMLYNICNFHSGIGHIIHWRAIESKDVRTYKEYALYTKE